MKRLNHLLASSVPPPGLSVLFWVGIGIVAACLASILVAEWFMPDNAAGRRGVITFYRTFGTFAFIEGMLAAWAFGAQRVTMTSSDTSSEVTV